MPYKIVSKAYKALKEGKVRKDLTEMQTLAMEYAYEHKDEWFHAADVARNYKYPNGQWFRGVLSSLEKKGLLVKGEE